MTRVPFIANTGFDHDSDMAALARGQADAIATGVAFLANPDLVARFAAGATRFNTSDPTTFYGTEAAGYTDYPTMAQADAEAM
jgi:N-ethylmaleimide reductase